MYPRKDYSGCRKLCLFPASAGKKFFYFSVVYILTTLTVYRCTNTLWVWLGIISSLVPIIEMTIVKKKTNFDIKSSLVLSFVLITKKTPLKTTHPQSSQFLVKLVSGADIKCRKKVVILIFTTVMPKVT